jgi:uncharacterized protein (DUF952 family)
VVAGVYRRRQPVMYVERKTFPHLYREKAIAAVYRDKDRQITTLKRKKQRSVPYTGRMDTER